MSGSRQRINIRSIDERTTKITQRKTVVGLLDESRPIIAEIIVESLSTVEHRAWPNGAVSFNSPGVRSINVYVSANR
jgi:hypothetical protein